MQTAPITALAGYSALPSAGDLAAWRGLCALLLTTGDKWRQRVNAKQGFPPQAEDARAKVCKKRMEALLASLQGETTPLRMLALIRRIPQGGYGPDQVEILQSLHRVLLRATAEMRLVIAETGQTDFSEISLRAEQALGSAGEPSELLLRLDYALDHILVDEFQDTSWSQYRLLLRLTEGWQAGDGRSLFLVGDPMQSIYGFRDAEVGIFVSVWQQQRLGSVALHPLGLRVNFRSSSALVDWYNGCFQRVLPKESDAAIGAVAYTPAESAPGGAARDGAGVVCHPGRDLRDEARQVADTARRLREQYPQDSVAVLVRARHHLETILPELHRAIARPVQGLQLARLVEHPTVGDLMALTRALLHPADRVAWLAVLRAPWCGLTRADLHALVEQAGDATILECLQQGSGFVGEGPEPARLARVWGVLADALKHRHQRPLRDWVETTWQALGGPDCCPDAQALEAAWAYLDELEQRDRAGDLDDPPWLEQALEGSYVPPHPEADARLQVMTMHQAKGLEFDHVILPGLHRYGQRDDDPLILWHALPEAGGATRTLAAVQDAPDVAKGVATAYRFALALNQERNEYERARLLYVACTRARVSLHLFGVTRWDLQSGAVKTPDRRSLLYRLWPVVENAFAPLDGVDDAAQTAPDATPVALRRLAARWQPPELPADLPADGPSQTTLAGLAPIAYDWAGEAARIAGIVVHEYLRRIARGGLDRWDAARVAGERTRIGQRLRQHGLPEEELEETTKRVCRALDGALRDAPGRWILGAHESARNEYALQYFDGGRLCTAVLDRSFVDQDGVRWIIDYKAGFRRGDVAAFMAQEQERYRDQLERYARVMRGLENNERPIKVALYYPLLGAMRAWTPEFEPL